MNEEFQAPQIVEEPKEDKSEFYEHYAHKMVYTLEQMIVAGIVTVLFATLSWIGIVGYNNSVTIKHIDTQMDALTSAVTKQDTANENRFNRLEWEVATQKESLNLHVLDDINRFNQKRNR